MTTPEKNTNKSFYQKHNIAIIFSAIVLASAIAASVYFGKYRPDLLFKSTAANVLVCIVAAVSIIGLGLLIDCFICPSTQTSDPKDVDTTQTQQTQIK